MSIGRRLGRLARGFVSKSIDEERLRETIRVSRERGETLKGAFEAARRGFAEEWRAAEERTVEEEPYRERTGRASGYWSEAWRAAPRYVPKKYPPEVLVAYHKLGLSPGSPLEEASRKRRELVKLHHPDRFADPAHRERAERLTAEINAAHDVVERYLLRG